MMPIQTKKTEKAAICTKNIEELKIQKEYLKYFNVQSVNCSNIKLLNNLVLKVCAVRSEIILQTQKFKVGKWESGIQKTVSYPVLIILTSKLIDLLVC